MERYVLRIRLPDRPGALGLVASRIGSVGVDIVAVNILRRTGGSAVDEFVVELSRHDLVDLLRNEIHEVDGAVIEEIRPVAGTDSAALADIVDHAGIAADPGFADADASTDPAGP